MNAKNHLRQNGIRTFHRDEDGMEPIQVVMLVAIAALILMALKGQVWAAIKTWVLRKVGELTSSSGW
jgi:hypothetical protein